MKIIHKQKNRRRGVSPIVSTMIIMAVTLTVGLATWSYVNSEARVSSEGLGDQTASYVNQLRERFIITNVAFDYNATTPGSQSGAVSVWVYNNGNITTRISQVFIGTSPTSLGEVSSFTLSSVSIQPKQAGYVVFPYSTALGVTYYTKIVGEFGNSDTYAQKK